eukprot:4184493-Alexandrium_andersonii.AAC.1
MSASLVGSEMCIRDRNTRPVALPDPPGRTGRACRRGRPTAALAAAKRRRCLLYTSDAADDM